MLQRGFGNPTDKIAFDPIFSREFFLSANTKSNFEVDFPAKLPRSPETLHLFFIGNDGEAFKVTMVSLINDLERWAKLNNINTDGIELFRFHHLNGENITHPIMFHLFHDGMPALYTIVHNHLKNPKIAADNKKNIIKNLIEDIGQCAPGAYTHIVNAHLEFTSLINLPHRLMLVRRRLAEQIVQEYLREHLFGQQIGNEIHYINLILNRNSLELGINEIDDPYANHRLDFNVIRGADNYFRKNITRILTLDTIIEKCIEELDVPELPENLQKDYTSSLKDFEMALNHLGLLTEKQQLAPTDYLYKNINGKYDISWRAEFTLPLSIYQRLQNLKFLNEDLLAGSDLMPLHFALDDNINAHIHLSRTSAYNYVEQDNKIYSFTPYWVDLLCSDDENRFHLLQSLIVQTDTLPTPILHDGLVQFLQSPEFIEKSLEERAAAVSHLLPCLPILYRGHTVYLKQLQAAFNEKGPEGFVNEFIEAEKWLAEDSSRLTYLTSMLNTGSNHAELKTFIQDLPEEVVKNYITSVEDILIISHQADNELLLLLIGKLPSLFTNHIDLMTILENVPSKSRFNLLQAFGNEKRHELIQHDNEKITAVLQCMPKKDRNSAKSLLDGFTIWLNHFSSQSSQREAFTFLQASSDKLEYMLGSDFSDKYVQVREIANKYHIRLIEFVGTEKLLGLIQNAEDAMVLIKECPLNDVNELLTAITKKIGNPFQTARHLIALWHALQDSPAKLAAVSHAVNSGQVENKKEILRSLCEECQNPSEIFIWLGKDFFIEQLDCEGLVRLFGKTKEFNSQRRLISFLEAQSITNCVTSISDLVSILASVSPWLHQHLINKIGVNAFYDNIQTIDHLVAVLAITSNYHQIDLLDNLGTEFIKLIMQTPTTNNDPFSQLPAATQAHIVNLMQKTEDIHVSQMSFLATSRTSPIIQDENKKNSAVTQKMG